MRMTLALIHLTSRVIFTDTQDNAATLKPYHFPFQDKMLPLYTLHDVLGYIMTLAVGPGLGTYIKSEGDLQALLALYSKFMCVLHQGPGKLPYAAHISYSSESPLLPQRVIFSSSPLFAETTSFSASILGSNQSWGDLKTRV